MHLSSIVKKAVCIGSFFLLATAVSGCFQNSGVMSDTTMLPAPTVSSQVQSYGDISLPMEMKLVAKETMALDTESFQGGIHQYKGRIDFDSLRDYFISSMRNNKWKLAGEARYNYVMLAFTKPNKTCMIILKPGLLGNTIANFYVTVDIAAASNLNPFGEPVKQ